MSNSAALLPSPPKPMLDMLLRLAAAACMAFFLYRAIGRFIVTLDPVFLLLAIGESLTIGLIVLARAPVVRSTHPVDVGVTVAATMYFVFISLENGQALMAEPWPWLLQGAAIGWQIYAKWTLGRSFGLLPANRGIVSHGPYALVRHPIYLGYFVGHAGFLLAYFSWHNALLMAVLYTIQVVRLLREERVLATDMAYRGYMQQTRWRLLPGVF